MNPLLWIAIGAVGLLAVACAVEALAKGNKVSNLRVFTNDVETFVAQDLEDLAKVYVEFYGETMEEIGADLSEFKLVRDDHPIKIFLDEDGSAFPAEQWPQGAIENRDENGKISLTATAGAWAKSNGRGFLCSTEY